MFGGGKMAERKKNTSRSKDSSGDGSKGLKNVVRDLASTVGLGMVFETERAIRKSVEEYLTGRFDQLVRDFGDRLATELGEFLKNLSVADEMRKVLDEYQINLTINIKFQKRQKNKK